VILKGIIDPNDVVIAETIGVDAIWISNHGGRQLDTVPATI
jgi:isopentenyl diphosphate isomerase/L-lactate dehydrogenase-like FMN-dependent dehydrogenase